MHKMIAILCALTGATPLFADPNAPLVVQAPVAGQPVGVPVLLQDRPVVRKYCNNAARPSPVTTGPGKPFTLACDHIFVGAGILGVMAVLGAASATN